jgi:hypothetical protein
MAKQVSSIGLAKRVSSIAMQLRVIGGISPADSVPVEQYIHTQGMVVRKSL